MLIVVREAQINNGHIRQMTKALLDRMDDMCVDGIRRKLEFWPGGDIRNSGNLWLRAAYNKSALVTCPREKSIQQSLHNIIQKKKLRPQLSCILGCATMV